ncbi:protein KRI1 homolog [Epargyreus clarus]|uniref:protein KRI1 homolog n=1 Tax=Epargyreus clarus TaxID=520877 RepID=UPI003C2B114E
MSKKKLFDDDSEEEVTIKTENEYAKKYDAWREKEEIHKLEQKYGSKALDPDGMLSSDSEDESDNPPEVSEEMETQFLKTLALLKTKDPRIYDPDFKFFDEKEPEPKEKNLENKDKPKTLTFADSDDDDDDDPNIFTIEKKAEIGKEEPDARKNEGSEKKLKEGKLKDFLTGKVEHIENEVEKDLEPLKAFWSDPKLNEGEAFLRDYILNKRYMEDGDEVGEVADKLRDDEELEADEALVEEQGKFERAYNFRFEEPDDEYLKRYPRTMNSIRPRDERRARKRAELRTRKEDEKKKKMEEIARLKALKLKEIQEKIARIKMVTGNEELAFKDEDIEGEFDPEEHDRRMRAIFDEEYYGHADDQKPVFPDLDEELEIENWEKYEKEETDEYIQQDSADYEEAPHCEDEDFNMDADYDPKKARENLLEELKNSMGKKRRNRKKKTKLGQLLATEKPKFVPELDKSYAQFMEEYYKMDCEDVVGGDLPTRFKYREVVPNDYGLSIEEILLADDKELTQWVPLKKIVKHRPPNVEKSEVNTYKQKAADVALKRKMLPSLFKDLPEEPEVVVPVDGNKKKRKKKKKQKEQTESKTTVEEDDQTASARAEEIANVDETPAKDKKKKKRKRDQNLVEDSQDDVEQVVNENNENQESRIEEVNDNTDERVFKEKSKNKNKLINITEQGSSDHPNVPDNDSSENTVNGTEVNAKKQNVKTKKKHNDAFVVETVGNVEPSQASGETNINNENKKSKKRTNSEGSQNNELSIRKKPKNKVDPTQNQNMNRKKNKNKDFKMKFKAKDKFKQKQGTDKPTHPFSNLSDERLKAYGLNPKKYKNFLKYKKF